MLVKYWMKRDVGTVDVNDTLRKAARLLKTSQGLLLPVLEEGRLIGVITEEHLCKAMDTRTEHDEDDYPQPIDPEMKVGERMSTNFLTVTPDYTVEDVVQLLLKHNLRGAPVTDDRGRVVGTITQTDLYRALVAMAGFNGKGTQFAFELENRPGSLKEVTDIIRKHGGRIASILTSYETAPPGYRHAYVRVFAVEPERIAELTRALSNAAKLIYGESTKV